MVELCERISTALKSQNIAISAIYGRENGITLIGLAKNFYQLQLAQTQAMHLAQGIQIHTSCVKVENF